MIRKSNFILLIIVVLCFIQPLHATDYTHQEDLKLTTPVMETKLNLNMNLNLMRTNPDVKSYKFNL